MIIDLGIKCCILQHSAEDFCPVAFIASEIGLFHVSEKKEKKKKNLPKTSKMLGKKGAEKTCFKIAGILSVQWSWAPGTITLLILIFF